MQTPTSSPTLAGLLLVATLTTLVAVGDVSAQEAPNTNPAERVLYPANGQAPEVQAADQQVCYAWSTESTEWDPREAFEELEDEFSDQVAQYQSGRGSAVRGALAGLAIGAAAGGLRGGLRGRGRRAAAQEAFEAAAAEFRTSVEA